MPALIEKLGDLYTFKDSGASTRVARFIERYPSLTTVLLEARDPLQRIFPEGRYALDARRDPDMDDEQLVLSIGIRRDRAAPRDGIARLIAFQDAWGLDGDRRAEGHITVVLESL
jgi:hypothetical protein